MRTQLSLLVTAVAAAALSSSSGGAGARTSADPLCYTASVTTAVTSTTTVGPICAPFPGATICGPTDLNLLPVADVVVVGCIPAPVDPPQQS